MCFASVHSLACLLLPLETLPHGSSSLLGKPKVQPLSYSGWWLNVKSSLLILQAYTPLVSMKSCSPGSLGLSEHLNFCSFLSLSLYLLFSWMAPSAHWYSHPHTHSVIWFITCFNHDSYANNSSPDLSPLIHISWRGWSSLGCLMGLNASMSRAGFISPLGLFNYKEQGLTDPD